MNRTAADLRVFLEHVGWKQYEADRRADVPLGRTANYLRQGGPKPPAEYLDALARASGLAATWKDLQLGGHRPATANEHRREYGSRELPFAGDVPAGEWGDPLESVERVAVWPEAYGERRFVARAVGESCYPAILQGDLLIFQSDKAPPYGKIVLAQREEDHGCTLKQLQFNRAEKRPVLRTVNPFVDDPDETGGWYAVARLIGLEREVDGATVRFFHPEGLTAKQLMFGSASE